MGYQPIENLLPKTGWSIYKLTRLASRRASELASGRKPLVETDPKTKTATVALEEIQNAQVVLKDVADEFRPEPQAEEEKGAEGEIEV